MLLIDGLFVGFPDGAEVISLTAIVIMAAAVVPYGMSLIRVKIAAPSMS